MKLATIGFFDGVHRGHLCLLGQLRERAQEFGMEPMVVTFRNHPRQVVSPDYVPSLLTTPSEKLALLMGMGMEVRMLDFTEEMSRQSARQFMQWLHDAQDVRALLMGYDHRFGHGGGTPEGYASWGRETGVEVLVAAELPDFHVSSSACRRALQAGDVAEAGKLLGHAYPLQGTVTSGHRIGREMGFPTANVQPEAGKLLPRQGAYAVWVVLENGSRWRGMLNIGRRPTIDCDHAVTVEVNLMDFHGDLYGQHLTLEFVARLRDESRFDSREALAAQLQSDAARAKAILDQLTQTP